MQPCRSAALGVLSNVRDLLARLAPRADAHAFCASARGVWGAIAVAAGRLKYFSAARRRPAAADFLTAGQRKPAMRPLQAGADPHSLSPRTLFVRAWL